MTTELLHPAPEAAVDTDEAFLALVCADDDLLHAEFEAIIGASWPAVPRRPAHLSWPEAPSPRHGPLCLTPIVAPTDRDDPGDIGRGRQRSPPRALCHADAGPCTQRTRSRGR